MINRLTILTTMTNTITINVIDPLYRHHRLYGYRYHTHHHYTVKGLCLLSTKQLLAIHYFLGCQCTWQSCCCLQLKSHFQHHHIKNIPRSSNLSFVPPVIVVLRMFNSLDTSALFFTDSDKVTINSFVSADS